MKRYYLALDLIDDEALIKQYELWHTNGWPEIKKSILDSGIINMEIYRTGNRLFMALEVEDDFDFVNKAKMDKANPKVQEWEELMSRFQQPLPWAAKNEKWVLMERIFEL